MPIFKMTLHTGFPSATHKSELHIDGDEWKEMSEEEKEKYLDEAALDFLHEKCEVSIKEKK